MCLPERVVLNADLVSAESFTDSFHFLLFRRARRVCYCAAAVVPWSPVVMGEQRLGLLKRCSPRGGCEAATSGWRSSWGGFGPSLVSPRSALQKRVKRPGRGSPHAKKKQVISNHSIIDVDMAWALCSVNAGITIPCEMFLNPSSSALEIKRNAGIASHGTLEMVFWQCNTKVIYSAAFGFCREMQTCTFLILFDVRESYREGHFNFVIWLEWNTDTCAFRRELRIIPLCC